MSYNAYRDPAAAHRTTRRTLILCEGRATETGYFEAMRRHLRLPADTVAVLGTKGTALWTLVQAASKERELRIEQGRFDPKGGDRVWVVCDGDEHRKADPAAWKRAVAMAAERDIHLAISNPSFELWYLLHFQEQHAALNAHDAARCVAQHVPKYTKALGLFPQPLLPLTAAAVARARALDQAARREGEGFEANPRTGVYHLVADLLGLG